MSQPKSGFANRSHFEGKSAVVREIYDRLIKVMKAFGPISEEPKKTFDSYRESKRAWSPPLSAL